MQGLPGPYRLVMDAGFPVAAISLWLARRWACLIVGAALLVSVAAPAVARDLTEQETRDLQEGISAYRIGDYDAALAKLEPLAQSRVPDALYYLGFMHAQGLGVPQSYEKAAQFYQQAAVLGHLEAQNYLGLLYFEGLGVARDFRRAFIFFELAAAEGNRDAANNRLIVARKMTSEQITEAQKEAGRLLSKLREETFIAVPLRLASGVLVTEQGHVLTHRRAAEECEELKVRIDEETYEARIAATDRFNGLALLKVVEAPPRAATFRDRPIEPGEPVTVAGYFLNPDLAVEQNVIESEITEAPGLDRVDKRYFQVSGPVGDGSLGAPVLDDRGRLVGIIDTGVVFENVAKVDEKPNTEVSFAVKQELGRLVLQLNGLRYYDEARSPRIGAEDLERWARAISVAVECWKVQ